MNQKWELFKSDLNNVINKNRHNQSMEQFYVIIKPYLNKELEYGEKEYKEVCKMLRDIGFRKSGQSVRQSLESNNIPYECTDKGLTILIYN